MINFAKKLASRSKFDRAKVGALICKGKRVISTGYNQSYRGDSRLDPRFKNWPDSLHAEACAIYKLYFKNKVHRLKGATIYIVRTLSNGDLGISKPCKFCRELIESVGIKKIVYISITGEHVVEKIK